MIEIACRERRHSNCIADDCDCECHEIARRWDDERAQLAAAQAENAQLRAQLQAAQAENQRLGLALMWIESHPRGCADADAADQMQARATAALNEYNKTI